MFDYPKVADGLLTFVKGYTDKAIAGLTQRVATLEAVTPRDGRDGAKGVDGRPGVDGKDGRDGQPGRDGKDGIDGISGKDGKDGLEGVAGKDGRDGFSLDDFDASLQEDGRTVVLSFARGDTTFKVELGFPVMIYRGVYDEGRAYTIGDTVTCGGSIWHCDKDTAERPDKSEAWTLAVKRGRDGKSGKDGERGIEGKTGAPGRDLTQMGPDGSKW